MSVLTFEEKDWGKNVLIFVKILFVFGGCFFCVLVQYIFEICSQSGPKILHIRFFFFFFEKEKSFSYLN